MGRGGAPHAYPDGMSAPDEYADSHAGEDADVEGVEPEAVVSDDLLSTLEVIESQPVADRARAYAALHEDLSRRLEAGEQRRP